MSESSRPEHESLMLDRRAFLSSVGIAAGAAIAGAMLPLSVAGAAQADIGAAANVDGLWSVDVICGHWPPYSHPIPYGRMDGGETSFAAADQAPDLDQMLVA